PTSKYSTRADLPRPVTKISSSMPASRASSTAYWISGRSTIVIISLGTVLVAGSRRVPRPATGNTALRTRAVIQAPGVGLDAVTVVAGTFDGGIPAGSEGAAPPLGGGRSNGSAARG